MSKIYEELQDLQEEIYNENCEDYFLRYTIQGEVEVITLVIMKYDMDIEVGLWNSENEERNWYDSTNNYEDLKPFIKRKINDCIKAFKELKGILK